MKRLTLLAVASLFASAAWAEDLQIQPGFDSAKWLDRRSSIEIMTSRDLLATEGRLAFFIDETDVTELFRREPGKFVYGQDSLPLPRGEHQLVVYLVSAEGQWTEKGRFPIKVLTRGAFEKLEFQPVLDLSNKGQVDQDFVPESNTPPRGTFQDATMQTGWRSELKRGNLVFRTNLSATGVTYENEALRFGEKGEDAPMVDLANYQFQLEEGPAQLSIGSVSFGNQRHLVSGFGSRGAVASLALGKVVSLHAAATNGTSIVGWDNFIGLSNSEHQMIGAGVGIELMPSHPGALRIETWLLDGSLRPLDHFNQGSIRSAEKSRGYAYRVGIATPAQRFTLDGGYARSRYTPARDVELEEGIEVTPLEITSRNAFYADVAVALIQNRQITPTTQANLRAGYHFERVDPLFRSIAVYAQSDVERHAWDLAGNIGPLTLQFSQGEFEDNIDGIRSILQTKTEQVGVNVGIQLSTFRSGKPRAGLLPMLTASWNRTHQFGTYVPENAGFSPSHVPDQVSLATGAGIEWQAGKVRFGYRWSAAEQDNRQPGRERADFDSDVGGFFFGITPHPRLDLSLDLGVDEQQNIEFIRTDQTRRGGMNVNWRMFGDTALSANYSVTRAHDDQRTSESDSNNGFLELSSGFNLWKRQSPQSGKTRVFVRYGSDESSFRDNTFGTNSENEGWTISTGVNVSVF